MIRVASEQDIEGIKGIADKSKHALGFILRSSLRESITHGELIVSQDGDEITGFCHYHHRRDGQTTIYEICVRVDRRRTGIGRDLIEYLAQEARQRYQHNLTLKCPHDLEANHIYPHLHFSLIDTQPGRKRVLNIWRRPL